MFKMQGGGSQSKPALHDSQDVYRVNRTLSAPLPVRSEQATMGFVIIEPDRNESDKKICWLNKEALNILEKGEEPITGAHFFKTLSKAVHQVMDMQSDESQSGQSVIFKSGRRSYSVYTVPLLQHQGAGAYGVATAKKSLLVLARMPVEEPNLPILNRKFGFTPRESNIVRLLFRGRSDKLIGQTLGISTETVREHMRNIRAKLGAVSRLEVVSFLLEK